MIVIDTSVWIPYFRGRDRKIMHRVHDLLDNDQVALTGPIRLELLSGASKEQHGRLHRVLAAVPTYYPSWDTWMTIEEWIASGLQQGHHFGAMDLLIAAMTHEHDAELWSNDGDFQRMARLGWIQLFSESSAT